MALTREDIDKILGKQSVVSRAFQSNQPSVTSTPRGVVSGTYADLLQPVTNNAVGNFLFGDIQRGLNAMSYGEPTTYGGNLQTGGINPA